MWKSRLTVLTKNFQRSCSVVTRKSHSSSSSAASACAMPRSTTTRPPPTTISSRSLHSVASSSSSSHSSSSHHLSSPAHQQKQQQQRQQLRYFESEGDYHQVADETLEGLQDAVEQALEGLGDTTATFNVDDMDISLASGVLTIQLPPHGTWVINKQTPNRQIWWSSPLSGPMRFEYAADGKLWFATQNGLSLVPLLSQELSHVLKTEIELQLEDF